MTRRSVAEAVILVRQTESLKMRTHTAGAEEFAAFDNTINDLEGR